MKRKIPLMICGPLIAAATLTAPIGEASAACSVNSYLTQGKRGSDQVRCLQQTLNDQGYNSGPVDGWFGPVTRGAVVAYQTANGLVVDGIVGPQTGGALGVWSAMVRRDRSATRAAAPAASGGGAPSSRWDRIARCESGGNWNYGLVTNRTGTYSGGLMIWTKAWDAYGGNEFASDAYLASKAQQIIVAERILADRGWRAWDCA